MLKQLFLKRSTLYRAIILRDRTRCKAFSVGVKKTVPFTLALLSLTKLCEFRENREQVWRSDESTRLLPMCPGSIPGLSVICGLSLLLILVLAPRYFSPGTPVFLSPQKPTFLNSSSTSRMSPNRALR